MKQPNPSSMNSLWVWYLADPSAPQRVGTVSLTAAVGKCSFSYDAGWDASGFPLSPDMPTGTGRPILPPSLWDAPGALDDAMPDRWGQNMIRVVDRPRRLSVLDFLYYAGDRRFGALGISSDPDAYRPHSEGPLLSADSLEEAHEVIQRVLARLPLTERERVLLRSSKNMGGAHPKMLVAIDGEEWLAKFPKGDPVDLPLVEYATMALARQAGIEPPESRILRIPTGHIVLTKRFDRVDGRRIHALSARTMLIPERSESYSSMADVIRRTAEEFGLMRERHELFARMAFNMMIENSDDHLKNHAFLRLESGKYRLSPAFDILPQLNGLGKQAIPVSLESVTDDFASAIAAGAAFGLDREEAVAAWRSVAAAVSRWREVFSDAGVTDGDMDYLSDFIDSPDRVDMRDDAIADTLPPLRTGNPRRR